MSDKQIHFEDYAAIIMAALVHKQETPPELPNGELAAAAVALAEALVKGLEHRRGSVTEALTEAVAEELNKRRRHAVSLAEELEHCREDLKSRGAELNEPPVHPRCKCVSCDVDECEDRELAAAVVEELLPPEPAELGPYPRLCPGCGKRAPKPCPYRSADLKLGREVCTAVGVKTFNPTGRCMLCPGAYCPDCRQRRAEVHEIE